MFVQKNVGLEHRALKTWLATQNIAHIVATDDVEAELHNLDALVERKHALLCIVQNHIRCLVVAAQSALPPPPHARYGAIKAKGAVILTDPRTTMKRPSWVTQPTALFI